MDLGPTNETPHDLRPADHSEHLTPPGTSGGKPIATTTITPTATLHDPVLAPTPEPAARPGMSTRKQLVLVGALAALAIAAYLLAPSLSTRFFPKPATPEPHAAAAPNAAFKPTDTQWANLKIIPVKTETFRTTRETDGKIALDDDYNTPVFSPYSGRVAKLFAKAGDMVQAGAPLLAIESTEFVQGQNDLVTAVSTLATARAQLRLAIGNEKRQRELFQANAGALKDWQQAQVDLATAQGGQNGAEIALGAVRNRLRILGKTDKEIADLEAGKDGQRFNPSSVLVAPIPGTVTQRAVGLGQYLVSQSSGGGTPVFTIGDLTHLWLIANVREVDAPFVHLNDPVEVRVPAYPGRLFHAKVVYVAPSIDPNTHRLPVRAEIDNSDATLKPEMYATFSIISGKDATAIGVPDSAVVYEGEKARVFVADPKAKTIEIREIKLGRSAGPNLEVTEGLKPGESIVTSGAVFIDRALQGD